jgi:SAM-dependent methyltransferase
VQFYQRIHALLDELPSDPTVVDFGAGRGASLDNALPVHRRLMDLRTRAQRVIGVDVEDAVKANPLLTEAIVVRCGEPIPIGDRAADLILADHCFEHIEDTASVAAELRRIVRPGGWICARTPNRWGYVAIAARAVPNGLHGFLLRRLQPARQERDVFQTFYRLNTFRAIEAHFPSVEFKQAVYGWEPECAYGGGSPAIVRACDLLRRVTPERLRPVLLIFLQKRKAH